MANRRSAVQGRGMAEPLQVALLVETSNAYARGLLRGVHAWQREHGGWRLRLSELGRGAAPPEWLRDWHGHGVIARVENTAIARALRRLRRPVVDVSAALARPLFPRVMTDPAAVTRLALEHLRERGLREVAYCGDARFWWARQRGRHFLAQARQAGLPCHLYAPEGAGTPRPGGDREMRELARWLRGLPRPVGVLACYDLRGQQVLEACQAEGLRVPEEVAVLGVHNDDLVCELCSPPLSSIIPDAEGAGYEAAALLQRLLAGQTVPREVRLIPPRGVARRRSTDVVAVSDPRLATAVRHMREHAREGIGIKEVLRAVPMSRSLLERRFREQLGCTPHEHLRRMRLEEVRKLLVDTDWSIALVAERTGFAYPEYLAASFRRQFGESPRAYRRRHRPRPAAPASGSRA